MKKNCELCKGAARVYCESDQASLCWSCDAKVHSANFLVARHVRSLLCHSCQSPTPWTGSGHKLGRTISICEPCVKSRVPVPDNITQSHGLPIDQDSESGIDNDTDDEDEEEEEEEELLDEDNQVVPLSCCSSERPDIDINVSPEGSGDYVADLNSKDDLESSSPRRINTTVTGSCSSLGDEDEYIDSLSLRPFKFRKLEASQVGGAQNNSTTASRIEEALQKFHHRRDRKVSGGGAQVHECVDLDLNECPSN